MRLDVDARPRSGGAQPGAAALRHAAVPAADGPARQGQSEHGKVAERARQGRRASTARSERAPEGRGASERRRQAASPASSSSVHEPRCPLPVASSETGGVTAETPILPGVRRTRQVPLTRVRGAPNVTEHPAELMSPK